MASRISQFRYPAGARVGDDLRNRYGYDGDLLKIYEETAGHVVHKWHHYLPLYDRYFAPWRGTPVRFLEIGVSKGGSLHMWRRYLGPAAVIFGIDILPECADLGGAAAEVRIGSQADPAFLAAVVQEMGGVDVVLDDGSHRMDHVRSSLQALFPLLSNGGTYMIEDLHTAFWPEYGGGTNAGDGNFFNELRRVIDDMHHWYHPEAIANPALAGHVTGLHVHDSLVVLDKGVAQRPTHSKVGTG